MEVNIIMFNVQSYNMRSHTWYRWFSRVCFKVLSSTNKTFVSSVLGTANSLTMIY
jgi:hypothetical protein